MIGLVLRLPKFMIYYGFSPGFIFSFLSTGQEIGWKKRLRYDLYCVEWDVKPQLNQSIKPLDELPVTAVWAVTGILDQWPVGAVTISTSDM